MMPPLRETRCRRIVQPCRPSVVVLGAVLAVVGLWGPGAAAAQDREPGRHGLTLELGARQEGVDDAVASPVRYTAVAFLVGASYTYRPSDWRVGVAGHWSASRLEPDGLDDPSIFEDALSVALDAWAARRVWRSDSGRWAAFLGPAAAVELGLRRHDFGRGQKRYDNGFIGLELAGMLEWSPSWGGKLTERVMVPVAGLAVRTSYTGLASEGPETTVALPPTFLLLRHRLAYVRPLTRRLALSVHHEGSYVRHTEPLELAVAWQRLGIGLQLHWGAP